MCLNDCINLSDIMGSGAKDNTAYLVAKNWKSFFPKLILESLLVFTWRSWHEFVQEAEVTSLAIIAILDSYVFIYQILRVTGWNPEF